MRRNILLALALIALVTLGKTLEASENQTTTCPTSNINLEKIEILRTSK